MTRGDALDKYIELMSDFEESSLRALSNSVRLHYGFQRRNRLLNNIGQAIFDLNNKLSSLEQYLDFEELSRARVYHLNMIYSNVFSFLSHSPQYYTEPIAKNLPLISEELDSIFTKVYANESKHSIVEYFDSLIDANLGRAATEELIEKALSSGRTLGYVSTNETAKTCYICRFWMGKVGSVGVDVPGFIRLDEVVPLHIRCIHFIILLDDLSEAEKYAQPEEWMLEATRSDYYHKFKELPGGEEILREQRREYRQSPRSQRERLKRVNNLLLR